jgi:hypothetical protein
MADNDLDRAGKRRFAQAFTTTMRIGGAGRKRGYVIGVVAAVVISAGVAVAIGAIGHGKPGRSSNLLGVSAPSRTSSTSPTRSASGDRLVRPGSSQPTDILTGGGGPSGNNPPGGTVPGGTAPDPPRSTIRSTNTSDPPKPAPRSTNTSDPPKPAPSTAVPIEASNATSGSLFTTGQLDCQSGAQVEGVWVQAADAGGSGWASWKKLDNGSVADWWYTLPSNESYHLNVGCGGSPANWTVTVKSSNVTGWHNSFDCYDSPGPHYLSCILR